MVPRPEWMPENAYGFLSMVPHYESGWRNIRNYLYNDDPRKGPIKTASGLWQITNTNWNHYAPGLDIRDARDPSKPARTAMDALPEDQLKVAYALWKEQGEQPWTGFNRDLAIARQTGVQARPASPQELALYGFKGAAGGGGAGGAGGGAMSATARKGLGLDGAAGAGGIVPASYNEGGGVGGSPFTVDASGNLIDTRRGEMAPPVPGVGGGPPGGAPAAPAAPAPPTGPPEWLTNLAGPTVANAIGSAPASTMGQGGTGFLGGLTSMLSNPLAQAALKGYFTAISAPRNTSPFGRVGLGGLGALEGLNQAQYQQAVLPIMQQRAQAAADAAKAMATYRQGLALGPERIGAANNATADALIAAAQRPGISPNQQTAFLATAESIRNNTSKLIPFSEATKAAQQMAGTQETEYKTSTLDPAKVAELGSKRALEEALAGDQPYKTAKEQAETAAAEAKAATAPADRAAKIANARDKFGKQYDAQLSVLQRAGQWLWGGPDREAYIDQQMKAAGLEGAGPAPGGPTAPLAPPPGAPGGLGGGAPPAVPSPSATATPSAPTSAPFTRVVKGKTYQFPPGSTPGIDSDTGRVRYRMPDGSEGDAVEVPGEVAGGPSPTGG